MRASNPKTNPLKAKTFAATLERTADRLRWVIARVPFDAAKLWGKRGQIKVLGEIHGFAFSTTLFPDGQGHHFFIVNKKMLTAGKRRQDSRQNFGSSQTQLRASLFHRRQSCCVSWDSQSGC